MKGRSFLATPLFMVSMLCFAVANGSWLKNVPQADRERVNPYAGQAEAVAAGKNVFQNNCAKCHGADAGGKGSRPSLKSERIQKASDGELAWLIKNGEPFKGMPSWGGLPEQRRWQVITYVRSLSAPAAGGQQ
jgi:mono/diheme cytochrome c family protein